MSYKLRYGLVPSATREFFSTQPTFSRRALDIVDDVSAYLAAIPNPSISSLLVAREPTSSDLRPRQTLDYRRSRPSTWWKLGCN